LEPLLEPPVPEKRWGAPRVQAGLAVLMAQSMAPPSYDPARWSEPDVQAQRRAEAEKRQAEMAQHYEKMTRQQEERRNQEGTAAEQQLQKGGGDHNGHGAGG